MYFFLIIYYNIKAKDTLFAYNCNLRKNWKGSLTENSTFVNSYLRHKKIGVELKKKQYNFLDNSYVMGRLRSITTQPKYNLVNI